MNKLQIIGALKRLDTHIRAGLKDTLSDKRVLASMFLLVSIVILSATGGYLAGLTRANEDAVSVASSTQSGQIKRSAAPSNADPTETAKQIGLLKRRIAHMSTNGEAMLSIVDIRRVAYDQRISGRPLINGRKSSGFGYRTDPITGARHRHQGLDFSGPVGEPILTLVDGIVTFSGKNSGYGNRAMAI